MQKPGLASELDSRIGQESESRVRLVKTFRFEAAHRLENHEGKCSRLHGHSYVLEVAMEAPYGEINCNPGTSNNGMLMDFNDISDIVKTEIINRLDHQFIISKETPQEFIAMLAPRHEGVSLPIEASTAELIAGWIAWHIMSTMGILGELDKTLLERVTLWETVTGSATWYRSSMLTISPTQ